MHVLYCNNQPNYQIQQMLCIYIVANGTPVRTQNVFRLKYVRNIF